MVDLTSQVEKIEKVLPDDVSTYFVEKFDYFTSVDKLMRENFTYEHELSEGSLEMKNAIDKFMTTVEIDNIDQIKKLLLELAEKDVVEADHELQRIEKELSEEHPDDMKYKVLDTSVKKGEQAQEVIQKKIKDEDVSEWVDTAIENFHNQRDNTSRGKLLVDKVKYLQKKKDALHVIDVLKYGK